MLHIGDLVVSFILRWGQPSKAGCPLMYVKNDPTPIKEIAFCPGKKELEPYVVIVASYFMYI